jgi:hypothetical protein
MGAHMLQTTAAVQGSSPMAEKTVTKTIRLPTDVAEKLETFAKEHAAETRLPVSQNAAIVLLLREAFEAREARAARKKQRS